MSCIISLKIKFYNLTKYNKNFNLKLVGRENFKFYFGYGIN